MSTLLISGLLPHPPKKPKLTLYPKIIILRE